MTDHWDTYFLVDRRKGTRRNRLRRFLNNYWLIPVFTLCLELFAVAFPPVDSPLKNLEARNLHFIKGPVILYKLASTDFPYTLIGHFKEIVLVNQYTFNFNQASTDDIAGAIKNTDSVTGIYRSVIESRVQKDTEVGGVATLVNDSGSPRLRLYEITSMNRIFSEKLDQLKNSSVEEFLSFIEKEESQQILRKVGIDENLEKIFRKVLLSEKPSDYQKRDLIAGFIHNYDLHSESKYILSPFDLKAFLGSVSIEGKYVGLFHFHNNYMEPPSDVDIANSMKDRQLVFTLGDKGIILYDLVKGKESVSHGDIDAPLTL